MTMLKNFFSKLKTTTRVSIVSGGGNCNDDSQETKLSVAEQEKLILELLNERGQLSTAEIGAELGIGRDAATRHLRSLVTNNQVATVGHGSNVKYTTDLAALACGRQI